MNYDAILVVAFGGPEGMDEVMPFLDNVLRGRNVPEERKLEVAEHYCKIGGISPLNGQIRQLIDTLRAELSSHGIDLPIYWGNRNWHPLLKDTVAQMAADGVKRGLAFVASAYSSYSSCRQYRENIEDARKSFGARAPKIDKIRLFYNHPGFINANCAQIRSAISGIPNDRINSTKIIFTAHSIPLSMACNCLYEQQLQEAGNLIAKELNWDNWDLVYQSRSGSPSQPWLAPDICDFLRGPSIKGITDVIIAPIGFVSDHVEVLYDLDTEAREVCSELKLNMVLSKTVGTHPLFITAIGELIEGRLFDDKPRLAIGNFGPNADRCGTNCCPRQ